MQGSSTNGLRALGQRTMEMTGRCAHTWARIPPTHASNCSPICTSAREQTGTLARDGCPWPVVHAPLARVGWLAHLRMRERAASCCGGVCGCSRLRMSPAHAACRMGLLVLRQCVWLCVWAHMPILKLLSFPPVHKLGKVGDLCSNALPGLALLYMQEPTLKSVSAN